MKNIDEALAWLYSNRSKVKDIQLKRISFILNDLDIYPKFKVVEIAGTNGKGSTAIYLKNILKNSGLRVGLFTSPYILKFNERIMINDSYIKDEEIISYTSLLYAYQNKYRNKFNDIIPFFELMLIMALMHFKKNNIDIAILECGIGGKYDAVNSISADLSIITSIGYDHINTLGSTKEEILAHKIGISRANKPLVIAINELLDEIKSHQDRLGFKLYNIYNEVSNIDISNKTAFTYKNRKYLACMIGAYQAYNASIAIEAANILYPEISIEAVRHGLLEASLPGRFQIINRDPLIIVDGAHNISAINELVNNVKRLNKKVNIVFQALVDKDYINIIKALDKIANKFYFTALDDPRATNPAELIKYTAKEAKIISNSDIFNIKISSDELLLITGSLHFVGAILNKFNKIKNS